MAKRTFAQVERNARRVLEDLEQVVGELSQAGEDQAAAVATRLHNRAGIARDRLVDLEEGTAMRVRSLGRHARTYARYHPWTAGGIALAAIAFGVLAWGRRR